MGRKLTGDRPTPTTLRDEAVAASVTHERTAETA
jgi:hypothetical protein